MNILNIEHVSKVFGEKVVLDDVSYGVHQGDKIGIIGINGTGKSTILKIIGGLEEPDEGRVGERLESLSCHNASLVRYSCSSRQLDS